MASITTSAAATPSPATSARSRARASAFFAGSRRRLSKSSPRPLQRRRHVLGRAILQRDRETAQRRPGGDVPAHDARADHVHVADLGSALAARALQAILQQEHAHQVARGLGGEQVRNRARLGLERRRTVRPVARPQLDDGVGGRVVRARCAPRHLRVSARRTNGRSGALLSSRSPSAARRGAGGCSTSSRAARRSCASGTSRSSSPALRAFSPRSGLPVSIISMAVRTPATRTLRTVPPKPG